MGNAVDFQKVRKRRQRAQTLRRLMVLVGIVALLGLVVLLNSLFIEEGLTTRIGDFIESFGGTGYPIPTPGGVIKDVKTMGNNLAVLNDTNLYLYNKKGKQVSNIQQMTENTVLLANNSRMLHFDVGSKTFAVYSASKQLLQREEEDTITGGALGDSDVFAIVTTPRQYLGRVIVYNKQFKEIYRWSSAENLITGVAVSPRGNSMAVSTINTTQNGVLEHSLRFFRFSAREEQVLSFPGELIINTEYHGEDRVAVLTDQSFHIVDLSGGVLNSYSFHGIPVSKSEISGNLSLVLTEYKETRTHKLILLDAKGDEISTLSIPNTVRDMAVGSRRVYVLTDQGIHTYNHAMELQETLELRGISRIHLIGGRLYYFTADEICLLEDSQAAASKAVPGPEEEAEAEDPPLQPETPQPESDGAGGESLSEEEADGENNGDGAPETEEPPEDSPIDAPEDSAPDESDGGNAPVEQAQPEG